MRRRGMTYRPSRTILRVMRVLRAQRLRTTVSCALASATALLLLVVLLMFAVHAVASDGGDTAAAAATAPEAVMPGVTELTEDNFDGLVGKRRAAFVEFYAPWCGHCKRLARDMATLGRVVQQAAAASASAASAAAAEHSKEDDKNSNTRGDGSRRGKAKKPLSSRLLIGKVDATAQSALAERFAIRSFPTLLYFAPSSAAAGGGQPEEYRGGRSVEDMVRYLDAKISAHNNNNNAAAGGGDGAGALLTQLRALAPDEVHRARELTAFDFARVVGNTSTSTLILFYAPWCAHCAALKPVYNALTSIFARNDDVVIARVDATAPAHAAVVAPYKVSSFPTLYLVPHGNTARARRFRGTSRSLEALVQFVNDVTAMPRLVDGSVSVHYGTDAALRKQLVQLHRALCNSKASNGGGGGGDEVDDAAVVAAVRRVKDGAARWRDARVSQYYAYLADVLLSLAHGNNSNTVTTTSGDDDSGNSNATASAPHRLTGAAMMEAWRTWLVQALEQLRDAADDAHASAARDEAQIRVNILQYLKDVL